MTLDEKVDKIAKGLRNLCNDNGFRELQSLKLSLTIDGIIAISLIANIQTATRNPANIGPCREMAEEFARNLQKMVAEKVPSVEPIMTMGWDPDFDF